MLKLPSGLIFFVLVLLAGTGGVFLFNHYKNAYTVRIHIPGDAWLHDLPWDYKELYGKSASHVVDSVFTIRSEAAVVALSQTVGPLTSTDREPFEAGFESMLKKKGSKVGRCRAVKTDDDTWNCLEWYQTIDGIPVRNRSYLSGRGITKIVVTFSSDDGNFHRFGETDRWLRELVEWKGPSLLYAM